jgi:hypothetical protein
MGLVNIEVDELQFFEKKVNSRKISEQLRRDDPPPFD